MGGILSYISRNVGRWIDVIESVVKVVEKVVSALVEIVPLTPTTKDDQIVAWVQTATGVVRESLDRVRNFLYNVTGN